MHSNSVAQTRAIQRRDRPWVDAYVTIVSGPFAMPSVDAIRDAIVAVAQRYPDSRLRWGFDDTKRRWFTDRSVESIVVERDWDGESSFGTVLDSMAKDASLEPPLALVRYPNHFGMKMSHSLGDGLIFVSVVAAAMLTAISGEVVPWPTVTAGRFPLLRAGLSTFGRNPALLRSALRDRFRSNEPGTGGPSRPWRPSRHTIYRSLPSSQTDEIYSWAAKYAPGASRFAVQTMLLLRALRRVDMRISDDVRVMVDLRSHLGAGFIDGNFFAGVPMRIDWDMTPEQVSATVKATKASGRPLVNQMATSLRVGSSPPLPTVVDDGQLPQVTFSYLGAPPQVDWLPYLPDHQPVYAASVEPGGPHGLTFVHGHSRGHMILNACFHDNVIDPALLDAAMKLISADPIGLLSEPAGTR
jgi:hypothetical protein